MSITARRAIRRGRGAWKRGDLKAALDDLERALAAAPNALEALYPMARILAESDQRDRALAVLEQASSLDTGGNIGRVFAAVLHYDYGEWQEARQAIDGIEERNVFARSLNALLDLETTKIDRLVLNRGALWISEMAGRLLAALEVRLFTKGPSEVNAFHQKLFTDGGDASAGAPPAESAPEKDEPERFQLDRDWWAALEAAFRAGDHERVIRLYRRREVSDAWRDVISRVLGGYSLLALGKAKQALEEALIAARQNDASPWPNVLAGLSSTGLGDRRHAIYAFVRAAQRSDIEMHRMITELGRRLEVTIEFLD